MRGWGDEKSKNFGVSKVFGPPPCRPFTRGGKEWAASPRRSDENEMKAPVLQRQPLITRRPHSRNPLQEIANDRPLRGCAAQLAMGAAPVFGEQGTQDLAVLARHVRDDMSLGCGEVQQRCVICTMDVEKLAEVGIPQLSTR